MTIQEEAWIFFQVFLLAKQSKFEAITPPISCNSLDNQRSGYQQHEQLALQPLDPALKSDEEIMLEILDYCNPCEPGTRNQLGQCFIPRQKFEWVVNRHALNGWVFQNHFNCVSAAVAGAINTVKQTNRTKPLVSARDIDFAFLVHAEANFLSLYKQLIAQYPEIDFKPVWEYLVDIIFL
jgi:hypothetical protein